MKKFMLALFCALSVAGYAASLVTHDNPKDGDEISSRYVGRLASVDVFSTVAEGTVNISRIFSAPYYTNAVDTTSAVVTNVVKTPNVTTLWERDNGWVYEYDAEKSAVSQTWTSTNDVGVDAIGGSIKGELSYVQALGNWVYGATNRLGTTGVYSSGGTVDQKRIEFVGYNGEPSIIFDRYDTITGYTYTTNIVTVVTTNSIRKVKAYDLTVTNTIFSGSCSTNCFHGSPDPDVWIFPNDRLLFKGTATGGTMRLVIE